MSRSGYSEDCDGWDLIRWRGAVASAIRGKRGQAFLREMLAALDAMPDKRLISGEWVTQEGEACALGAVALARGTDVSDLDIEDDASRVGARFGITKALAAEIMFENDEACGYSISGSGDPGARRFTYVRNWIVSQLKSTR